MKVLLLIFASSVIKSLQNLSFAPELDILQSRPAPAKQLFSFRLSDGALNRLSAAAEQYLLTQTERRFGTLDYWKSVK